MSDTDMKFLQSAHRKVAVLVLHDPAYLPIFERIEKEIAPMNEPQQSGVQHPKSHQQTSLSLPQ